MAAQRKRAEGRQRQAGNMRSTRLNTPSDNAGARLGTTRQSAKTRGDGQARTLGSQQMQRGQNQQSMAGASRKTRGAQNEAGASQASPNASSTLASVRSRISPPLVIAAVVLLVVVVFAARLCTSAASITVSVNGSQYVLHGAKTMQTAIKESGLPINPGDFISLKGNILQKYEGAPFAATVNGNPTTDPAYQLHEGDVVVVSDGDDTVESYDYYEMPVPYGATVVGVGAVHSFTDGVDGVKEIRTGVVSGEEIEKQTVDPIDLACNCWDPDVGDEKIIALTFDDGPDEDHTQDILSILADNDAKATFFCLGSAVENGGAQLVLEEVEQGHQVCSHTYDNARASGESEIGKLSAEEQTEQVEKGFAVLADALGWEPTRIVRLPGDSLGEQTILNIAPLIDSEVRWTIDTGDWIYMTEDDIYDVLMSVKPGSIVRMHDGGGDHTNTVVALKRALPQLKRQGYSFVTVDELLEIARSKG